MEKLDFNQMDSLNGGTLKQVVAEIGCLGVGMSFAVINPIVGLIAGIGCSMAVYYYA